jgi:hypothetical protein
VCLSEPSPPDVDVRCVAREYAVERAVDRYVEMVESLS